MKTLIPNYSFSASSKTVQFEDYAGITLENVLLITNVSTGTIIYNFADPLAGGSVTGNVLSLVFDTTGMSDTDSLQIFYDDPAATPATDETLSVMQASMVALQEQNLLMRRLLKMLEPVSVADINQRQRVVVDAIGTFSPTNTTVKPVENSNAVIYSINSNSFGSLVAIPDVWRYVDAARLNYQQAIRANITF